MSPSVLLIICLVVLPTFTIGDPMPKPGRVQLVNLDGAKFPRRSGSSQGGGTFLGVPKIGVPSRVPARGQGTSDLGTTGGVEGIPLSTLSNNGIRRVPHRGSRKNEIPRRNSHRNIHYHSHSGPQFDLTGSPQVIQFGDGGLTGGFSVGSLGSITEFIPSGSIVIGGQASTGTITESWTEIFEQTQSVIITSSISDSYSSSEQATGNCDYCSGAVIETSPYAFGIVEIDSVIDSGDIVKSTIQIENNEVPIDVPKDGSLISKLLLKLKLITILRTNITNLLRFLMAIPTAKRNNDLYEAILAVYNAFNLRQINIELLLPVLPKLFTLGPERQLHVLVTELIKIVPVEIVTYVQQLVVHIQRVDLTVYLGSTVGIPNLFEGCSQEEVSYIIDAKKTVIDTSVGIIGERPSFNIPPRNVPSYTDINIDVKNVNYIVEEILRPLVVQINYNPQKDLIKNVVYLTLVNLPLDFGIPEAPIRVRDFALKLITLLPDDVWDVIIPKLKVIAVDDIYTCVRRFLDLIVSVPSCPALMTTYVKIVKQYIPLACPAEVSLNAFLQPPPQPSIIVLPTRPDAMSVSASSATFPVLESRFGYAISEDTEIIVSADPPSDDDYLYPATVLPTCSDSVYSCDLVQEIRVFLKRPEIVAFITSLNLTPDNFPSKISLMQYVLRQIIQFNLGGTNILLRIKEYLHILELNTFTVTFEPWYTALLRVLRFPTKGYERQYYDAIVQWISQSNVLGDIGSRFKPSGSLTCGPLLKNIFQSALTVTSVHQNKLLLEAIQYYKDRISADGLGALPFNWYQVYETYVNDEFVESRPITVDLNSIFKALNRDSLSVGLEKRLYDFFSYEFQPTVHLVGFNYSRYHTKGEWFKALVEHLVSQKSVSHKWKTVLQSVKTFIRLNGPGAEPVIVLN